MPVRTPISPETIDRLVQLAESGCTSTEIMAELGVSRSTVYKFARHKIKRGKVGHDWTREQVQFLDDHYLVDMTAREVADALGLARNQVKAKACHIGIAATRSPLHIIQKPELQTLITMACAGESVADIAERTGVAKQTILHHINKRKTVHRLWIRHAPERRSEAHRKVYQEGRGGFARINRERRKDHGSVPSTAGAPTEARNDRPDAGLG